MPFEMDIICRPQFINQRAQLAFFSTFSIDVKGQLWQFFFGPNHCSHQPVNMLFSRQTRGGNHREWGTIFVLRQACKTSNWNGIDSRLMVGVFSKLLRQDFFLTVGRNNKEVHLICVGKLILVVVVPQDILIVNIIGTEVLCVNDHT